MLRRNGEPVSLLDENEKGILKKYHLLRNAVAHKSASAKAKFEAVIGNPALTPREKTPKGYLRVLPNGPGGLTQYQIAVTELQAIATKLCPVTRFMRSTSRRCLRPATALTLAKEPQCIRICP